MILIDTKISTLTGMATITDVLNSVPTDRYETALNIAKKLGYKSKADVNPLLYKLLEQGSIIMKQDTNPPTWTRVQHDVTEEEHRTFVIVDLGNCHDVLQNLESLVNNTLHVIAYADFAFNGYGINPQPQNKLIKVHQATVTHKNAADTMMIWDLSRLVMSHSEESLTIYIVTKDAGFQTLKTKIEESNPLHKVQFVRGWNDLRVLIA